jgi:hypothetical protein
LKQEVKENRKGRRGKKREERHTRMDNFFDFVRIEKETIQPEENRKTGKEQKKKKR